MSKLSDKIRRVTRMHPPPIGFGAGKAAVEPTLVLVGTARDARSAAGLAGRGADAVMLGDQRSPAPASALRDLNGGIRGAWIAGKAENEASAYKEAGADFVVFDPATAAATAVLEQEIGYVISIPRDFTDNEARTLESFQLDAILVDPVDGALTVRRQIDLRRLFAMTRKPLMAAVHPSISLTELQALRDANVAVVMAEGGDNVERLRKTIDALPPRSRRRDTDDRPVPLVPHSAMVEEADDDHEHE